MPSPHVPATTAAIEATGPQLPRVELRDDSTTGSSSANRGRQPSLTLRGLDRRPRSPPPPARPKPEAVPKRANSMPRLSESACTESARSTTTSAPPQVTLVLPPVQIPAPTVEEITTTTPAPEVTSDAETLPLPGLPGAVESENVPSPVEEETERTMDDPYVNVLEGVTANESAPHETVPPVAALQEHLGISTSSTIMTGAGGSGADIPLPEVTAVSGRF